jgi:hypothetical protein
LKAPKQYLIRGSRVRLNRLHTLLKERGFEGNLIYMKNGSAIVWLLDSANRDFDYFADSHPTKERHYLDAIEGLDVELSAMEEVERILKGLK